MDARSPVITSTTRPLRTELRALLALAAPLIIQNVANEGMQFTDTLMAGRLSTTTLAGVAVGGTIWVPVMLFAMGLLMALSPTVAHLHGAGNEEAVGAEVRQCLWLSQAIGWLGFVVLREAGPAFVWLGVAAPVVPAAQAYLNGIAWGLPGICLFFVLRFTSEGIGHTRPLLYVAFAGLGANAFMDYALMYGIWGLPALGAYGCGLATAIVIWLMFAVLLVHVVRARRYRPLAIFSHFEWPRRAPLATLLRLGFPIGVSLFMEVSLFAAIALIMGTLGTKIVAAHQIALNFAATMFMVPLGVSMAITARAGQARGRGDTASARRIGLLGIGVCMAFMVLSALAMALFPTTIAGWYTDNQQVRDIAVSLLGMAAIFQISDGLQVSAAGALRGYKDTHVPMWMTVLAYWCIGFPLAWLLGVYWQAGPRAVWGGFIGGLSVAAVLLNLRFWRISRGSDRKSGFSQISK
ncbi:MAG TPA: MATE family efflux transporter [Gammaproteobacteria bacterium]|nr:MATE family efflux transporter [Gammaproteobacteria bacterium]